MRFVRPAVAGMLAAAAGVAVAELLAAALLTATGRPGSSPVVAVGGAVIDATPTPVKEFAVRTFGTYDKPLLLGGIGLVLLAYAVVVGVLGHRRPRAGAVGAVVFGLVGCVAAVSRPAGTPVDGLPSLAGAAVAAIALLWLNRRWADRPRVTTGTGGGTSRRAFVGTAALVAAGAALTGGAAVTVRGSGGRAANRSRQAVRLPAPADPAAALPAGIAAGFTTSNADFYRVDTALTVPRIDVADFQLRVTGMVDRPLELSFADLLDRPLTERDITLNCVSNEVGGTYVGTARWLGAPLAPLLREAGILAGADQLVARSVDGMTIGTPVETIMDGRDAMLAVGMNGEPLPLVNGFPVRMLTPGLYGYAGSCKWLVELEVSTFDSFDVYWVRRGWAARAPVKTASRIDRPAPFATLPAGRATIAGVAWAQRRGISAVQVRIDDGDWREAELLPAPSSTDTWVQWRLAWPAAPGGHTLRVRAVDGRGDVQVEARATPFPDGATGWHTVAVTVT